MKNKFMRIAAVMLMLCLVTTCAISGTFAKYTTNGKAEDSARVAKWGVEVVAPADGEDATFATSYTAHDANFEGNSVLSGDDVIAPGTNGTLATPTITGTPEVAVRVTFSAVLTLTNWSVPATEGEGNVEYCPIEITVGTKTYGILGDASETYVKCTNIADLKSKVETAIAGYSADYAAGTNLAGDAVANASPVVKWSWAFNSDNDANDTALGNAEEAEISFKITVTVTQID